MLSRVKSKCNAVRIPGYSLINHPSNISSHQSLQPVLKSTHLPVVIKHIHAQAPPLVSCPTHPPITLHPRSSSHSATPQIFPRTSCTSLTVSGTNSMRLPSCSSKKARSNLIFVTARTSLALRSFAASLASSTSFSRRLSSMHFR